MTANRKGKVMMVYGAEHMSTNMDVNNVVKPTENLYADLKHILINAEDFGSCSVTKG